MEDFQTKNSTTPAERMSSCCGSHEHKSLFKIFFVLATVFLFVLIAFAAAGTLNKIKEWNFIGQSINNTNTITVSDIGEIYAKPDLAVTSFSVVTEAKTVAEAISENTTKMNAVIAAVKNQGVEDKDLKTINFSIAPHYDYYDQSKPISSSIGQRVLSGYDVTQSLQVKIRNLEKVGSIIQVAVDSGSNQAGDLQFTIDNQDELTKQAREQAITKTKAKAQELASQLGVKLVRIISFSENNYLPYYYSAEKSSVPLGMGGSVAPQIETGENSIQVTVSITYEID